MTMFDPGCQPSSRKPRSNGSRCTDAGSLELPGRSTPTRATLADCARTRPGAATSRAPAARRARLSRSGVSTLFPDQPVDDAAHRHPRLVLPEVDRRAGAEIHVLLLRLHHRHV